MRLELVIFDCDGVLIDSETNASTAIAAGARQIIKSLEEIPGV